MWLHVNNFVITRKSDNAFCHSVEICFIQTTGFSDFVLFLLCLQILTNGKYKSAQNRAITNATQVRLSVATFHDPAKAVKISPASELVSESSPRYREVLYGDYVSSWYTKGPDGKRNISSLLFNWWIGQPLAHRLSYHYLPWPCSLVIKWKHSK